MSKHNDYSPVISGESVAIAMFVFTNIVCLPIFAILQLVWFFVLPFAIWFKWDWVWNEGKLWGVFLFLYLYIDMWKECFEFMKFVTEDED